jgi:hypothetical protein
MGTLRGMKMAAWMLTLHFERELLTRVSSSQALCDNYSAQDDASNLAGFGSSLA